MKKQNILQTLQSLKKAMASLESAEKWLLILAEEEGIEVDYDVKVSAAQLNDVEVIGEEQVIEGVFDGKNMVAKDGTQYPVPANYASKSKLVEDDKLKLTIKSNGAFLYKQIEIAPRKIITGKLILDGTDYKVLVDDKMYNILYASVTFFKIQVGDDVAILVPENNPDATWGAVENVVPH